MWNDEAQDFVWMDAIKIGNRVYHASCHAEVKKDGESTPLRINTPDSVLGKRKAVVSICFDAYIRESVTDWCTGF